MINLHDESIYLQGARDVLMRLKDDYEMYLIPAAKYKTKPESQERGTSYCYFPLQGNKDRKLLGDAVYDALIHDRESLVRFLAADFEHLKIADVKRDKKGKAVSLKIVFE